MANQSQGASSPINAAYDAVASAYNLTHLSTSRFTQIGALFSAIEKFAEPHHVIKDLASLGNYLCSDLGNLHDCENEALQAHFDQFRALLYPNRENNNV